MVVAWFATAGVPLAALRAHLVVAVPPPLWLWVLPPAGRGLPVLTPLSEGPPGPGILSLSCRPCGTA
jgi:hypothetical protein